jgi:hypothetical protein
MHDKRATKYKFATDVTENQKNQTRMNTDDYRFLRPFGGSTLSTTLKTGALTAGFAQGFVKI